MHLATIRSVGVHAGKMLAGIAVAAILGYLVNRLVPGARLPTFFALSVAWILFGISFIVRKHHASEDSLAVLSTGILSLVIIFETAVLLVAIFVGRHEPVAILGPVIGILGTIFGVFFYAAVIAGTLQERRLEEDLAKKPTESSNHALQPTASRSG